MKKILETIKSRKLLSTITILTLIAAIFGILFISILSKENKELIINSITNFFSVIKNNQVNYSTTLFKSITNNLLLNLIIWLLGISIIGLPIVLIILSFDSFITSFTFTSILYTYKLKGILPAIIYIFPHLINILTIFILTYYSASFSLTLFNFLFRKKECNRKIIITRYLKLLLLSIIISIISGLIETYLIPIFIKMFKL